MTEIEFRSDFTVKLVNSTVEPDRMVVAAARVSTEGAASLDAEEHAGLIKFLMTNRHGCYDSNTEVLTSGGWVRWPEITGTEEFLTLNLLNDAIEYQKAEWVIHKRVDGPMVRVKTQTVDALVTPDHNMLARKRISGKGWHPYALISAHELTERSLRLRLGGGQYKGTVLDEVTASLLGFIVADAHVSKSGIEFHLTKDRKVSWLKNKFPSIVSSGNRYYLAGASPELIRLAKATYTESRDRCFPRELLESADGVTAGLLLDGYLEGDGHTRPNGHRECSTVSRQLADDLQELAVKAGRSCVEISAQASRDSAYGSRPLFRLSFPVRNSEPRIGWTPEDRAREVSVVDYHGDVHCVTVPNGTLYVRRNGKPMWSGNSPFEHNQFTFFIQAPIFVWRELMRHRIASYNEESGRYKQLEPVFYVPGLGRPLVQTGKAGKYVFEAGSPWQHARVAASLKDVAEHAYDDYEYLLEHGVAREVARMCLPLNIYSSAYVTMNARGLMNFFSLRTKHEDSMFPSFPQYEIEKVALEMENLWAAEMPLTAKAFTAGRRVAP